MSPASTRRPWPRPHIRLRPPAALDIDVLDTPEAGGGVIRGGALLSVTYVLGMLLTAVSVPFMTRALGVDEFGLFVTASSAVMIIAGVTEAGLSGIGTREYVVVERDAPQAACWPT